MSVFFAAAEPKAALTTTQNLFVNVSKVTQALTARVPAEQAILRVAKALVLKTS